MERNKQHLRIERKHPRIETGVHCVVGLQDSDLSSALICDMSIGGLKFSCGRHTIHNILPENMRTPGPVMDVVIEIHFELQRPGKDALAIKCHARVVHFVRLAQDNFHVGAQFTRMDKTSKSALHSYLEVPSEKQDA